MALHVNAEYSLVKNKLCNKIIDNTMTPLTIIIIIIIQWQHLFLVIIQSSYVLGWYVKLGSKNILTWATLS